MRSLLSNTQRKPNQNKNTLFSGNAMTLGVSLYYQPQNNSPKNTEKDTTLFMEDTQPKEPRHLIRSASIDSSFQVVETPRSPSPLVKRPLFSGQGLPDLNVISATTSATTSPSKKSDVSDVSDGFVLCKKKNEGETKTTTEASTALNQQVLSANAAQTEAPSNYHYILSWLTSPFSSENKKPAPQPASEIEKTFKAGS